HPLGNNNPFHENPLHSRVSGLPWRDQQRLRRLEVSGVQALGEPAVGRREQLAGCSMLALLLPQVGEAHSGPQLPGFGLLGGGRWKMDNVAGKN
ncbi:MAG TPA: hypothetical protein VIH59_03300, partial [Candidatus Tectomicrobia bacterium]